MWKKVREKDGSDSRIFRAWKDGWNRRGEDPLHRMLLRKPAGWAARRGEDPLHRMLLRKPAGWAVRRGEDPLHRMLLQKPAGWAARRGIWFAFWGLFLAGFVSCGDPSGEVYGLDALGEASESVTDETGLSPQKEVPEVSEESRQAMIYVYVCGAVRQPGVVELPEGSRAEAGVLAAGGMREDADPDYVNLAAPLSDGEKLYIPTLEEGIALKQDPGTESGLVNINTADSSALCTLPGIGESRAADIIAYREENGGFSAIEDIMKVPGIKENAFRKLKDLITV